MISDLFFDAIDILSLVANAFTDIWIPIFFLGFLIVVVDFIHYHLLGCDR